MIWVLISENALFEVNYNITLCFLAVHLRVSPFRGTRCYTVSVSREKLERHVHCQGDLSFRNHQVVLQGKRKAMATKQRPCAVWRLSVHRAPNSVFIEETHTHWLSWHWRWHLSEILTTLSSTHIFSKQIDWCLFGLKTRCHGNRWKSNFRVKMSAWKHRKGNITREKKK